MIKYRVKFIPLDNRKFVNLSSIKIDLMSMLQITTIFIGDSATNIAQNNHK